MKLLYPENWQDYELLDCGDFEKLERFGKYVLRRPEPQAVWSRQLDEKEWISRSDATFSQQGSHGGEWKGKLPSNWVIAYKHEGLKLRFKLALTSFKHVGIFPEQAANWDYIYKSLEAGKGSNASVLNLFAYTGGASLAARAAGADVVHVDSVRQVVGWARENMELSGLDNIRWTVEDAQRFVKREVKRGKKYNGIILDPPAYGIGAKGERWKLEDSINDMMADLAQLLNPDKHFFILNVYSLGLSALVVENLIRLHFPFAGKTETGELYLPASTGVKLPLGVFGRFGK